MGFRDKTSFSEVGIDYAHHEIHSGSHYFCTYAATVASAATMRILVTTPNTQKRAHMLFRVNSTLLTTYKIFEENESVRVAANALIARNNDRNSPNTSGLTISHTPTAGNNGDLIWEERFGTGTLPGNQGGGAGGFGRSDVEIILKQNTTYLYQITSGTNANLVSVVMEWYEHTNK